MSIRDNELMQDVEDIRSGLVVEDHQDARDWVRRALCLAFPNLTLHECTTLAQGKAALEEATPDIALIDLGLPDGSGVDLIERMNQQAPDAIVIVSTVFEDDAHVFAALRAGARGYVLKDESQDSLVDMLKGIVDGRPPLSPTIARRLLDHFHIRADDKAPNLTERERDVLTLLAKGYTVKKVAGLLEISANTAAGYVKTIYRKLNISTRAEATMEASKRGLISDDSA